MSIIDRYIIRVITAYILGAAFIILGVDALFAFVREMKSVGGDYSSLHATYYVLLTLPRRLYNMFPMASLLGAVMGLGMLAANSELIVMRSVGISFHRITWACLKGALLLTLIVTICGEFIVPATERIGTIMRATARGEGLAMFTEQGAWLKDGDSFIFISRLLPGGVMSHVFRYDFAPEHQLKVTTFAEKATFSEQRWHLTKVAKSMITTNQIRRQVLASETWDSHVNPEILKVLAMEPEDLSMRGLLRYIAYLDENQLDNAKYWLAFWQKVVQPLATLVMVYLAVPCIFGPLRNASMGLRIVGAVMLGFTFYILNKLFGPLSIVYHVPPLLGSIIPTALTFVLAIWLMRRTT